MPIEAVKIPQNVYVEDRIIGPVTLKQLLITGIGAGISYMLYAMATKSGYTSIPIVVVCWTPSVIFAAFAFMKINDLSLFNIILLMIENAQKQNVRYWSPHPGLTVHIVTRQATQEINNAATRAATDAAKLADMTEQLHKRQEELSKLTAPVEQKPSDVDAIGTRFESATKAGADSTNQPAAARTEEPAAVQPNRIQTSESLEKERSIDGIAGNLAAFDKLMTTNAS